MKEDIEKDNLIKEFMHQALKSRCWDSQETKGCCILAYNVPTAVPNYPLLPRSKQEEEALMRAKLRRRIELNAGGLYKQVAESARSGVSYYYDFCIINPFDCKIYLNSQI